MSPFETHPHPFIHPRLGLPTNVDIGGVSLNGGKSGTGGTYTKQPDDIAYKSPGYLDRIQDWLLVDALWEGPRGMREAGFLAAPPFEAEEVYDDGDDTSEGVFARYRASDYEDRIRRALLNNLFEEHVKDVSERPFERPVEITPPIEEWSESWQRIWKNIDGRGNGPTEFERAKFVGGMRQGARVILATMPSENSGNVRDGALPFLVQIPVTKVFLWREEMQEDGETIVSEFKYHTRVERRAEGDRFRLTQYDQIHLWTKEEWQIWEKEVDSTNWPDTPKEVSPNPLGEVPAAAFCPGDEGSGSRDIYCRPTFMGIADLCRGHWQTWSDLRSFEKISMAVILLLQGVDEEKKKKATVVGHHRGIALESTDSDGKLLETTGEAADVGHKELDRIENVVEMMRKLPFMARVGTATATEIDKQKNAQTAPIHNWVGQSQAASIKAIGFLERWMEADGVTDRQMPEGWSYEIFNRFALVSASIEDLKTALDLNERGLLSDRATLSMFQRTGRFIPDDVDVEEELTEARRDQMRRMLEAMEAMDDQSETQTPGDDDPDDEGEGQGDDQLESGRGRNS